MSRKIKVTPGKGQSKAGFFAGIVFCFIGLFIVIPTFGPFGIFWTIIAVIITITNGYNTFTDKGIASHEITIDELYQPDKDTSLGSNNKTSEQRLKELQGLYDKGMVTYNEYQEQRKRILDDL